MMTVNDNRAPFSLSILCCLIACLSCSDGHVRLEAEGSPPLKYECGSVQALDLDEAQLVTLQDYTARVTRRLVADPADSSLLRELMTAYEQMDWRTVQLIVAADACAAGVLDFRPPRFPEPGGAAPAVVFHDLYGDSMVALADFRGRITVVNFWGTWCAPCLAKYPELVALSEAYPDHVTVLQVLYGDNMSNARKWLAEHPGGRVIQLVDDGQVARRDFGVSFIPVMFVGEDHAVLPACASCRYRHHSVTDFADQLARGEWLDTDR